MSAAREQRRNQRSSYGGWVEIASDEGRALGKGRDLSQGGLGVALQAPHPRVATMVECEFQLPGIHLPLMLRSRVNWLDPTTGHVGLGFVDLDAGLAELIDNYVRGRL